MGQARSRRNIKSEKPVEYDLDADFIPLDVDDSVDQGNQGNDDNEGLARDNRSSFFGLLDRAELEYFKNAESVLATNALAASEKGAFIENLFEEAKGKELKLATNQVCSKLVERMISLASSVQMQQLTSSFEPFVVDLAYQKFSSHCLEAVIMASVPIEDTLDTLLAIVRRLGEFSTELWYDRYASHVLSTLILTLSGVQQSMRSRKSQLARKHTEIEQDSETSSSVSQVPAPLRKAGLDLVNKLIDSLDQVEARKLAIDPIGSPVAQALVVAEANLMSGYRFVDLILKDGSSFVSHSLSDNVGSHFLDTVVRILPAKKVSKFVDTLPLNKLAVSDNDSSRYLVQTVIAHSNLPKKRKHELLSLSSSKGGLNDSLGQNFGLSLAALDVDFDQFAPIITKVLLSFPDNTSSNEEAAKDSQDIDMRISSRAAIYEKLSGHGPFVEAAVDSIVAMEDKAIKDMAMDATQSYVLQSILKPGAPLVARKKIINRLVALIPSLVVNVYGSHIVDSLWAATFKLKFNRERIASELLKLEEQVKHSPYGRKVWKNWHMDKYNRKRNEWFNVVKDEEDKLRKELDLSDETPIQKAAKAAALTRDSPGPSKNVVKKRKLVH